MSDESDPTEVLRGIEEMTTSVESLTEILSQPWDTYLTPEERAEHQRALESVVEARAYAEAHAHEWVIWR